MTTFIVTLESDVLKVGFNPEKQATNEQIVKDAVAEIKAIKALVEGKLLRINGAMTVPTAMAIAHEVCHVCPAVGMWDPKLGKYVVVISHDPNFTLGQLID